MTSIKNLKFKVSNIKHLRCTKDMSFNQQFITKWKEAFRKELGVYEKLIDISKLFEV